MSSPTPGRVIRAALVILFFGTIVLGALSFVIYFNKEEKAQQRSIRYAASLRREMSEEVLNRHAQIIGEAMSKPAAERTSTLAAYIESTLGPENMGFTVRSIADKTSATAPPLALDVELTGTKRAQDIVLVVCGYVPSLTTVNTDDVTRPVAAMLGIAHSITGQPVTRTLRFLAVQQLDSLKPYYVEAIGARDRIVHLELLGTAAAFTDEEVLTALHLQNRGTVIERPTVTAPLLPSALKLREHWLQVADRL